MMQLVLASGSPRRQSLLRGLGLSFSVRTADIDETMDPSRGAEAEVARVSAAKAAAVLSAVPQDSLIIAADTVVCVDGRILGKPHSRGEAREMLTLLSGRTHQVRTGVTVRTADRVLTAVETTDVHFRPLNADEIEAYLDSGEPMDKAGAYGIQGLASVFVSGISGDYFNVMGLPLCRLCGMLRSFGVSVL